MGISSDGFSILYASHSERGLVAGVLQVKKMPGYMSSKLFLRPLLVLLLLLMELARVTRSSVLLSSSKLEECKNDAMNQTEDLSCKRKVILDLTVVHGKVQEGDAVETFVTSVQEVGGRVRELAEPYRITIYKSDVYAHYPLNFIKAFNYNPHEVASPAPNCNEADIDSMPNCGWLTGNRGIKVQHSQGFCCFCSFKDTLPKWMGGTKSVRRFDLDCSLKSSKVFYKGQLPWWRNGSVHCLRLSNKWYATYEILDPSLRVSIRVVSHQLSSEPGSIYMAKTKELNPLKLTISQTRQMNRERVNKERSVKAKFQASLNYTGPGPPTFDSLYLSIPNQEGKSDMIHDPNQWLALGKDNYTLDGSECNKIGVSYKAFQSQRDPCLQEIKSCCGKQLKIYADEEAKRQAETSETLYSISHHGRILSNLLDPDTQHLRMEMLLNKTLTSTLTLELKADDISFYKRSTGRLLEAFAHMFTKRRGTLFVKATNLGWQTGTFIMKVHNCSPGIGVLLSAKTVTLRVPAVISLVSYVLLVTNKTASFRFCKVSLFDSLGDQHDTLHVKFDSLQLIQWHSYRLKFATKAASSPPEQDEVFAPEPAPSPAKNDTGCRWYGLCWLFGWSGNSSKGSNWTYFNWTCGNCSTSVIRDLACFIRNYCWKPIITVFGGISITVIIGIGIYLLWQADELGPTGEKMLSYYQRGIDWVKGEKKDCADGEEEEKEEDSDDSDTGSSKSSSSGDSDSNDDGDGGSSKSSRTSRGLDDDGGSSKSSRRSKESRSRGLFGRLLLDNKKRKRQRDVYEDDDGDGGSSQSSRSSKRSKKSKQSKKRSGSLFGGYFSRKKKRNKLKKKKKNKKGGFKDKKEGKGFFSLLKGKKNKDTKRGEKEKKKKKKRGSLFSSTDEEEDKKDRKKHKKKEQKKSFSFMNIFGSGKKSDKKKKHSKVKGKKGKKRGSSSKKRGKKRRRKKGQKKRDHDEEAAEEDHEEESERKEEKRGLAKIKSGFSSFWSKLTVRKKEKPAELTKDSDAKEDGEEYEGEDEEKGFDYSDPEFDSGRGGRKIKGGRKERGRGSQRKRGKKETHRHGRDEESDSTKKKRRNKDKDGADHGSKSIEKKEKKTKKKDKKHEKKVADKGMEKKSGWFSRVFGSKENRDKKHKEEDNSEDDGDPQKAEVSQERHGATPTGASVKKEEKKKKKDKKKKEKEKGKKKKKKGKDTDREIEDKRAEKEKEKELQAQEPDWSGMQRLENLQQQPYIDPMNQQPGGGMLQNPYFPHNLKPDPAWGGMPQEPLLDPFGFPIQPQFFPPPPPPPFIPEPPPGPTEEKKKKKMKNKEKKEKKKGADVESTSTKQSPVSEVVVALAGSPAEKSGKKKKKKKKNKEKLATPEDGSTSEQLAYSAEEIAFPPEESPAPVLPEGAEARADTTALPVIPQKQTKKRKDKTKKKKGTKPEQTPEELAAEIEAKRAARMKKKETQAEEPDWSGMHQLERQAISGPPQVVVEHPVLPQEIEEIGPAQKAPKEEKAKNHKFLPALQPQPGPLSDHAEYGKTFGPMFAEGERTSGQLPLPPPPSASGPQPVQEVVAVAGQPHRRKEGAKRGKLYPAGQPLPGVPSNQMQQRNSPSENLQPDTMFATMFAEEESSSDQALSPPSPPPPSPPGLQSEQEVLSVTGQLHRKKGGKRDKLHPARQPPPGVPSKQMQQPNSPPDDLQPDTFGDIFAEEGETSLGPSRPLPLRRAGEVPPAAFPPTQPAQAGVPVPGQHRRREKDKTGQLLSSGQLAQGVISQEVSQQRLESPTENIEDGTIFGNMFAEGDTSLGPSPSTPLPSASQVLVGASIMDVPQPPVAAPPLQLAQAGLSLSGQPRRKSGNGGQPLSAGQPAQELPQQPPGLSADNRQDDTMFGNMFAEEGDTSSVPTPPPPPPKPTEVQIATEVVSPTNLLQRPIPATPLTQPAQQGIPVTRQVHKNKKREKAEPNPVVGNQNLEQQPGSPPTMGQTTDLSVDQKSDQVVQGVLQQVGPAPDGLESMFEDEETTLFLRPVSPAGKFAGDFPTTPTASSLQQLPSSPTLTPDSRAAPLQQRPSSPGSVLSIAGPSTGDPHPAPTPTPTAASSQQLPSSPGTCPSPAGPPAGGLPPNAVLPQQRPSSPGSAHLADTPVVDLPVTPTTSHPTAAPLQQRQSSPGPVPSTAGLDAGKLPPTSDDSIATSREQLPPSPAGPTNGVPWTSPPNSIAGELPPTPDDSTATSIEQLPPSPAGPTNGVPWTSSPLNSVAGDLKQPPASPTSPPYPAGLNVATALQTTTAAQPVPVNGFPFPTVQQILLPGSPAVPSSSLTLSQPSSQPVPYPSKTPSRTSSPLSPSQQPPQALLRRTKSSLPSSTQPRLRPQGASAPTPHSSQKRSHGPYQPAKSAPPPSSRSNLRSQATSPPTLPSKSITPPHNRHFSRSQPHPPHSSPQPRYQPQKSQSSQSQPQPHATLPPPPQIAQSSHSQTRPPSTPSPSPLRNIQSSSSQPRPQRRPPRPPPSGPPVQHPPPPSLPGPSSRQLPTPSRPEGANFDEMRNIVASRSLVYFNIERLQLDRYEKHSDLNGQSISVIGTLNSAPDNMFVFNLSKNYENRVKQNKTGARTETMESVGNLPCFHQLLTVICRTLTDYYFCKIYSSLDTQRTFSTGLLGTVAAMIYACLLYSLLGHSNRES